MKKSFVFMLLLAGLLIPSLSQAYIGVKVGVMDENQFGYGLTFGAGFPSNFGLEFNAIGFYNNNSTAAAGTRKTYWVQGDIDLTYDFSGIIKPLQSFNLHPYAKGGFTYGASLIDQTPFDIKASHGPGFNVGGGVDWKLLPFLTIGVDLQESVVFLNGVTVSGIVLENDHTAKSFSVMGVVKFFAY